MNSFDIWKFLAGIGLFLYGINLMETVLNILAGRPFKIFLQKLTGNLFTAIVGGVIVTGLLQSSSVVGLMMLAFTGAGIISFRNAFGVIMGSNLGTTLTGWIVATVGFQLDIEGYALAAVAVTTIAMFFTQSRIRLYHFFNLFFALGILFLGLGYMKEGGEKLVADFDLAAYTHHSLFVFLLIGFVLTTIIQSSSATVAITLTALHTSLLAFDAGVAVVIGSEIGTTIKILIGGIKGSAEKKRVAWGNFIYNLVMTVFAFTFMGSLIYFVKEIVGLQDPLTGLVFFQSLINVISILLFLPFINVFSGWLERRFSSDDETADSYISSELPAVPELAVDALRKEAEKMILKSIAFHNKVVGVEPGSPENGWRWRLKYFVRKTGTTDAEYKKLKATEGDILVYYTSLEKDDMDKVAYERVNQYVNAVRHAVHAAKSVKDVRHDFEEFRASANNTLYHRYYLLQEDWKHFAAMLLQILQAKTAADVSDMILEMMENAFGAFQQDSQSVTLELDSGQLQEIETSTLMNVARELLSCKKALLRAIAALKLSAEEADEFEYFPEHFKKNRNDHLRNIL